MAERTKRRQFFVAMLCGVLGCICFGLGDWLMIYGDTASHAGLYWLTEGVTQIPAWRNMLAMALSFPGIVFYGIGLFSLVFCIRLERERTIYIGLHVFGLTPWIALHLLYITILYLFAWMNGNGYADAAIPASEALFDQFSWVVVVSEAIMLPPYIYWFWLVAARKTTFPRAMALANPLLFYAVLSGVKLCLPEGAFRIGFTNALMSESMILWFLCLIIAVNRMHGHKQ